MSCKLSGCGHARTFAVCVTAQILLLVPLMCFVNDVISVCYEQGVLFFTSLSRWAFLCRVKNLTETYIGN
jgi:hypothetical protein